MDDFQFKYSRPGHYYKTNITKGKKMNSSWFDDMNISDFARDDNFFIAWSPAPQVKQPFLEVAFDKETSFNAIGIAELSQEKPGVDVKTKMDSYVLQFWDGKDWKNIDLQLIHQPVRIHRFQPLHASKLRLQIISWKHGLAIAEFLIYSEKRK